MAFCVKIASPVTIVPFSGSVFSISSAAVISLAAGSTRNWPITPSRPVLNAASRWMPGAVAVALPRRRLPSIATWPAGTALHPRAQNPLQRCDIEVTEQLAPHRGGGDTGACNAKRGQCFRAQSLSPAHNAQLVAPSGQHRGNRDQQQAGQRGALTLSPPVIRHGRQRLPQADRVTCFGRLH